MIVDLQQASASPASYAPVCIVGAGAAGISLAVELAGRGIDVMLLESGGLLPEPATQALYDSDIPGHRHNGVHTGRYRIFGGSTTQWGGQILELDPQDFETRPWVPGSGWPFPKSALAPHYRRALELEGLAAAIPDDASVWKALGVPEPAFGDTLVPFFTRWCPQPDFTRLFGAGLSEHPRITICLHANVTEILLSANRDAVTGLRGRTLAGGDFTFTAESYVFCMGGIETARLLLQPPPNAMAAPWNAAGLVGRHFQDHIDATLVEVVPRDRAQLHRWFDNVYRQGFKYHPKLKLAPSAQKRLGCLAIGATFEFKSSRQESLSEFREAAKKLTRGVLGPRAAMGLVRRLPDAGLLAQQAYRFKVQGRAFNPDDNGIFLRVHCEQSPDTQSRIALTSERDALGMLRCAVDWRVSDPEIATIRHFIAAIGSAFQPAFAHTKPFADLEKGGPALLARIDDSNHHMGATRMASSPQEGVVDPDLRLFGVRNGYVCSSSVFPSGGFSNPTHTLIALAVRLAEHLAGHSEVAAKAA